MNIELERAKIEPTHIVVDTKEADKNRKHGDAEIKTSCVSCKFKPNTHDAIPFYQQAADSYRAAQKYNDEIYCREKLIFCFQHQKSLYEEGSEHQKLSLIYLILKKYDLTIKSINNSYQCLIQNADYQDAVKSVLSIADKFQEINELGQAENCYKIGYDGFKLVFHVIATKKEEPTIFLYNALFQYLNILIKNNKIKLAIESCESAIKTIEPFEKDKSKIVETYALLLVLNILNNDIVEFKNKIELARKHCGKNSDLRFIQDIESIPLDIENGEDNQFRKHTVDVKVIFPNEIYKKLFEMYEENKNKMGNQRKKGVSKDNHDEHVIVLDEKDDNEYL